MEASAASLHATGGAHAAEHDHHGPPEAHRSSRVEPQLLGMLLFIISEVMVFGAFFTAYFFIRVVNGDVWPAEGTELTKLIAGFNTAILNAVQYFHISEIVISTLPEGSSQWMADKLVDRVRGATNVPVEHVITDPVPADVG